MAAGGRRLRREPMPGPARSIRWMGGERPGFMLVASRHGLSFIGGGTNQPVRSAFGATRCLAWAASKDGRHAAAGGEDGSVRVWDVMHGNLVAQLPKLLHPVVAVAFSPDGSRLLAITEDGLLRTWSRWEGRRGTRREFAGIRWGKDLPERSEIAAAMDAGRGVFVAGALAADGGGIVMAASMAADGAWEAIRLPAGTEARRFRKSPDGAWWLAHDLEPKDPREPSVVWLGHHGKDGWTSRMLSHPAACREVAFGAGDGRFTTMDHFFAWRRWRLDSGRLEAQHSLASAEVVDSALSDDGKVAALISMGITMNILKMPM